MQQQATLERTAVASLRVSTSIGRRDWTGLIVLLYGTLWAIFAAFVLYRNQTLFASTIDVNGFGLLSRNLALGHDFSIGHGPTLRRAPLYPLMGAAILKLTGQAGPDTQDVVAYQPIILMQCLIFGLTCLVTWAIARRLFGPRIALLAAALCPLIPQSLRYLGQTEVESVMSLFVALLAFTGLRLVQRPGIATGAQFGLTAAAATLTKPVTQFYPLVFLLLAWLAWYLGTRKRVGEAIPIRTRFVATLAVLVCFGLPLAPWIARNLAVTDGEFAAISSNAPGEALRGYVAVQPEYYLLQKDFGAWDPEANDYEEAILAPYGVPFYHVNAPENGTVQIVPPMPDGVSSAKLEADKDRIESAELRRMILSRPLDAVRKGTIQLATFWYLVVDRTQSKIVAVSVLALLVLVALGARKAYRERVAFWPVLAIVIYLNLVYAATLAMARYSMPLYPTLMVLAAAGIVSILSGPIRQVARRTGRIA